MPGGIKKPQKPKSHSKHYSNPFTDWFSLCWCTFVWMRANSACVRVCACVCEYCKRMSVYNVCITKRFLRDSGFLSWPSYTMIVLIRVAESPKYSEQARWANGLTSAHFKRVQFSNVVVFFVIFSSGIISTEVRKIGCVREKFKGVYWLCAEMSCMSTEL